MIINDSCESTCDLCALGQEAISIGVIININNSAVAWRCERAVVYVDVMAKKTCTGHSATHRHCC